MPRRALTLFAAVVTALALGAPVAAAQDPTSSSTTIGAAPQDIVPEPNSGTAPSEAGDRGGALQLGLLALMALVIGGAVSGLVRQSRQARSAKGR